MKNVIVNEDDLVKAKQIDKKGYTNCYDLFGRVFRYADRRRLSYKYLLEISKINNNSFHLPQELFYSGQDSHLIGYSITRTNLLDKEMAIDEIEDVSIEEFCNSLKELRKDIKSISDNNFLLYDIFYPTIQYNNKDIKIVFNDNFKLNNIHSTDYCYNNNIKSVNLEILYGLFNVKLLLDYINKKNNKMIFNDFSIYGDDFPEFLGELLNVVNEQFDTNYSSIGELKKVFKQ